jgi:threonine/homoserine/homoserine lactone efflux protein
MEMALVTREVSSAGRRSRRGRSSGISPGCSSTASRSPPGCRRCSWRRRPAYTVVKLAGAAYLVYLGVRALLASRHPTTQAPSAAVAGPSRRAFLQGLISTLLNPKPALFFLTFLPQFVDPDASVLPQRLTLAAIHVIVGLIWLSAYARLVHRAHGVLSAPRVKAWLERTTGVVLIAFGLRVAVERP